ncbi:hypothetical protein S83_018079 [Arachis hypogaea]
MSVDALGKLCELLKVQGGLRDECRVSIPEQVITFLIILAHHKIILAHHKKNRTLQVRFYRLGETISRYFNKVLSSVIHVQSLLFAKAVPVPDDCIDPRWKWFKGCLGALDGTYIDVTVPEKDKSRYRTRKGSASDSRILRDAISRRNNLKIPIENYYLVDAGYTNCKGFLAPYRHTRYHVQEWAHGRNAPRNFREYFNKKHSSARNIIERCFGLLKKRWAILRSHCFYKIKTQNKIIIACCLLQNFIRFNMEFDPEEDTLLEEEQVLIGDDHGGNEDGDDDMIESIEGSNDWTTWRDNLANEMYNDWMNSRIN